MIDHPWTDPRIRLARAIDLEHTARHADRQTGRTYQVLEVLALREREGGLAQILPHNVQVQQLLPREVQPPELHPVSAYGGVGGW